MLLSILVYSLTALTLFFLGWHVMKREERSLLAGEGQISFFSWEIIASILLVTVIFGARYYVGNDYEMYLKNFLAAQEGVEYSRTDFEPGFMLLTKVIAATGCHFFFYFAFWAFLQATCLTYSIRNHKFLLPWIFPILILGPYCMNWLTFTRQWVLACMLPLMIPIIQQRKWWLYLIYVAIALTIHRSAWILIIFYFAPRIVKPDKSRWLYLTIFLACVVLGMFPQWLRLFSYLNDLIGYIGYQKYDYLLSPLLDGDFCYKNWGPLHLVSLMTCLSLIWYYPKIREYHNESNFITVLFPIAFIGICYKYVFINTSFFLERPADYVWATMIILLAYVCNYLHKNKRTIELVLILILLLSYVYISIGKNYYLMSENRLYDFVIYNSFIGK